MQKNLYKKTYVIAEIGINHNGDLDLAKELIVMAKTYECDAVKFQKRDILTLKIESLNDSLTSLDLQILDKESNNDVAAEIGFHLVPLKIDGFIKDVLSHSPSIKTGQKCGMDRENTIAIDLKGNVITCQNVSHVQVSHNGESHHAGNIEDIEAVRIKTATHWSNRPACAECPVLHICKGSCMFIEGDNWTASCDSAYSDAVVFFALAIAKMTNGFIPTLIESENLPAERMDIWGDVFKHEEKPKIKAFPVKVVSVKKDVEGVEVYSKSAVVEV